ILYNVTYLPIDPASAQANSLQASNTPSSIAEVYLQLPETRNIYLSNNPLLAGNVSLFESYAQSHSVYDTALQVLGYLKSNFIFDPFAQYLGGSIDRVEWFLSNGGGTSLDFATTYSIFLRCLNISSRVVYGFLPGEVSGNSRIIRGWNTHFWVEVWNPTNTDEDNWVQFDPTPLTTNITDIVSTDPLVGNVEYTVTVTVNNNTDWAASPELVTRGSDIEIEAILLNNSTPMNEYLIEFYDETEQSLLGSNYTDSSGLAIINYNYATNSKIGIHILKASIPSLPLVFNYTILLIDGQTSITLDASPDPPINVTRNRDLILISGTLTDQDTGEPIPYQQVSITLDGQTIVTVTTDSNGNYNYDYLPPVSTQNKDSDLQAIFNGVFQSSLNGYQPSYFIPGSSSTSTIDTVIIVASTTVSTNVNATAVAPGNVIRIDGYLLFDNGSAYANQNVAIYWRDVNGEVLLATRTTDTSGYYYYDYQVPSDVSGEVKIFSIFESQDAYVLGSFTDPTIYVGEEKITNLVASTYSTSRGSIVVISGLLTNSTDDPLPGRTVITNFYVNDTKILASTYTSVTNELGIFQFSYTIPNNFQVGVYYVNCSTTSQVVVVSESFYLNITSTTTIDFSINPIFVVPGENFSIYGSIYDDQQTGIDVSLEFYLDGVLISNINSLNGEFNIINYSLPLGVSSEILNVTLRFNGEALYYASNLTKPIMVFTKSMVQITLEPDIVVPGEVVRININATDNYGRSIYQRTVRLYFNNTFLADVYLNNSIQIYEWTIPDGTPRGPIIVYGILISEGQTDYISDTLTVEERVALQLTTESIILLVAVLVIIAISVIVVWYYLKRRTKQKVRKSKPEILKGKILRLKSLINQGKKKEALFLMFEVLEELISQKFGINKKIYQTIREYVTRVIEKTDLNPKGLYSITLAVEKIKYGKIEIENPEFNQIKTYFTNLFKQLTGEETVFG
ncbi:MAG: transglutaminase domain-containing protein, partial [Candidatus Odinarchaeia archaeon]